jgi:hypothetical protein
MRNFSSPALTLRWAGIYALTECIVVFVASSTLATTWTGIAGCAVLEGTLLGLGQGLVLYGRRRFQRVLTWTAATLAGVLIGRLIEFTADTSQLAGSLLGANLAVQLLAGAALGACVGAASGMFQSTVLQRDVTAAYRWLLICSAAWALMLPALLLVGRVTAAVSSLPAAGAALALLAVFAAVGAAVGAFEGAGLAGLRRAPTPWRIFGRSASHAVHIPPLA